MVEQIRITADEINCLVYAFLMDSGFTHSAFTLRAEAQLDHSPLFHKHIVRGQLVELLCKALLYLEVEHHWKNNQVTLNCTAEFSLLGSHQCSSDATAKTVPIAHFPIAQELAAFQGNGISGLETASKRKDSSMTVDESLEKSAKPDAEDLHADSSSESYKSKRQDVVSVLSRTITPEPKRKLDLRTKVRGRKKSSQMDDLASGAMITLQGHTTEVFVLAWNTKNHAVLASGSKDAVVHIWSLPDPSTAPSKTIQPAASFFYLSKSDSADLTCLHWSPDGQLLAIGSYDAILRICKANGELYFAHHQHNGPIFASRFSISGQWLLTASLDGTSCLWNVAEKRLHRQFQCHTDCCLDVDWLDDWTFASCGADNLIFIMQVTEEGSIKTLSGHENEINEIRFNPTGTRLASCSDDMTARIWNIESISNASDAIPGLMSSDPVVILRGHNHSVNIIAWCPDHPRGTNHHVATSSFDGTARIWDSVTGDCLKVFTDHQRPLFAMTYSPSGKWLASGGADGWLHIYHVQSRTKRWSWHAGQEKPGVFEIDWLEDEGISRFAVALESRKVVVFNALAIPALQ
ncbi:hypothetical protein M378DRAFT_64518 [Amanita muscaria Koide BX008]|uniref:Anaphase-promoting complex subunit 4-like WD40 domain-containing protein n=1 Tax=Amanita muscaria (strain Koide BX008) TaxID=946122 RepID=A0A0C2T6N8_AMAMK|nr:hypothetical protein M378DRAFT_64518 [Amanita muscaria Koide BX008]